MKCKNETCRKKCYTAAAVIVSLAMVFAVSSCKKKEASPTLSAAFEKADSLIAVAGEADSVYLDYSRDVADALEPLISECNMYKGKAKKTVNQMAMARLVNDLSILFNDAEGLGDQPTTAQLREYHDAWIKLRDRFEAYVPAARKPPPKAPKELLQQ